MFFGRAFNIELSGKKMCTRIKGGPRLLPPLYQLGTLLLFCHVCVFLSFDELFGYGVQGWYPTLNLIGT